MRALVLIVVPLLLVLLAPAPTASAEESRPPAPPFWIVVHPDIRITTVDRTFLQDAFLKKVRTWPGGGVIHPVDMGRHSSVRARFSKEVLDRSVAAVNAYWQQRIFSGRDVPPPELDGDDKVLAYVLKREGAIGYVSGTADLRGVRVVSVRR